MTGSRSFCRASWTATRTPRERGPFALLEVVVADSVGAVSGHAEGGVEPVEGLLGGPLAGGVGVVGDHHDQRQPQPHPEVALGHRPDPLGAAHRGEQAHPAPSGLLAWIVLALVHHLAPDLRRFPG
jgi:hypothetical protein